VLRGKLIALPQQVTEYLLRPAPGEHLPRRCLLAQIASRVHSLTYHAQMSATFAQDCSKGRSCSEAKADLKACQAEPARMSCACSLISNTSRQRAMQPASSRAFGVFVTLASRIVEEITR
jgi:hypothetical protein